MEQLDLFSSLQDTDPVHEEYLELVKKLNHYAELYYSQDEPEISDFEYDTMNNRLKQIEMNLSYWAISIHLQAVMASIIQILLQITSRATEAFQL